MLLHFPIQQVSAFNKLQKLFNQNHCKGMIKILLSGGNEPFSPLKKLLTIMKLTAILFLVSTLGLSAANTYSQETKLNLDLENATIKDVLTEIKKQSDFSFWYNNNELNDNQRVTIVARNQTIDKILNTALKNQDVAYEIKDRHILIYKPSDPDMAVGRNFLRQQQFKVSGIVTDANTREPLPGVNISIEGTTTGVISNLDGKYSIMVPQVGITLVYSYVGYVSEKIEFTGQTAVNVELVPDIQKLDEVIVVGYGTVKRSDLTGSVARVGAQEIQESPVQNTMQALQGRAAGVDITSNARPGEMGSIRIRGNRSLLATNEPLYVVDGIPLASGGIEAVNPQDIESVDILKDASAAAIYGSRAANGVILITTKRGKAGKAQINYNTSVTFDKIDDLSENFNSAEYVKYRREAYRGMVVSNVTIDPDNPTMAMDQLILGQDPAAWATIANAWSGGTYDPSQLETTDWTGYVTRTGITQDHTLSASMGTEKIKTYISGGYLDQLGTNKGEDYKRYTGKINLEANPTEWFTFGGAFTGTWSVQNYGFSAGGSRGARRLYDAAKGMLPFAVPYDADGNFIYTPGGDLNIVNPILDYNYVTDERTNLRALGNFYGEIKFFDGLRYHVNFGPDFRNYRRGQFQSAQSSLRGGNSPSSSNYAALDQSQYFAYTLDNLLYYDKSFGKHTLGITLLQSSSLNRQESSNMNAIKLPYDSQLWYNLGSTTNGALNGYGSGYTKQTLMSYMGRINYTLMDKYLLTVSGRWDGSSVLAPGNKWDFFPSFALAWKMQDEAFLQGAGWLSQLKPRFGLGTTGNAAISPYSTLGGLVYMPYVFGSTVVNGYIVGDPKGASDAQGVLGNENLKWEKTTQWNLGIDLGLFANRVNGSFDYYHANTHDLLMPMSIPTIDGATSVYTNIGKTRNKGFEIVLSTVNFSRPNFKWTTNFTFSTNKEEIVELQNGKEDMVSNSWFIGQPVNIYYDYRKTGIWQIADSTLRKRYNELGKANYEAGDIRVADLNGDSIIDANNDREIVGTINPKWTGGITNTFNYKGIELSFFVYARWGQTIYVNAPDMQGRYASRKVDYWTVHNPTNAYPKADYGNGGQPVFWSSMNYQDGSFIAVKYISLGYTLPETVVGKMKLSNLKIYAQVLNPYLYTKTKFINPDVNAPSTISNSPSTSSILTRSFVVGLNATF